MIKYMPTLNCKDIQEICGSHWQDCEFTQGVENGVYVTLYLDDDAFDTLAEDIEWEIGKSQMRLQRLLNQKTLMVKLRKEYRIEEEILVKVEW